MICKGTESRKEYNVSYHPRRCFKPKQWTPRTGFTFIRSSAELYEEEEDREDRHLNNGKVWVIYQSWARDNCIASRQRQCVRQQQCDNVIELKEQRKKSWSLNGVATTNIVMMQ